VCHGSPFDQASPVSFLIRPALIYPAGATRYVEE